MTRDVSNNVSTTVTDMNGNAAISLSDQPVLSKIPEPDQGFVEADTVSTPSSSSTDFDSADEESVVSDRQLENPFSLVL